MLSVFGGWPNSFPIPLNASSPNAMPVETSVPSIAIASPIIPLIASSSLIPASLMSLKSISDLNVFALVPT